MKLLFSNEFTRKVDHPDWLASAVESLERSCRLNREGRVPEKIQAWMLVTPTRRLLRTIYGSDLRAALALLGKALTEPCRLWVIRVRIKFGWMKEEIAEMESQP